MGRLKRAFELIHRPQEENVDLSLWIPISGVMSGHESSRGYLYPFFLACL